MQKELHKKLDSVRSLAEASKVSRLLARPYQYVHAAFFRKISYARNRREKEVSCCTFFDTEMSLLLPCSTDIYLTGGKSDESEIRLAKFMINTLEAEDVFVDVGAHYGYFSLLGSLLVGSKGRVHSFEAAPRTYRVLDNNTTRFPNISANNLAISEEQGKMTFYEFPTLYSEYNTLNVEQFQNESWFDEQKPEKVLVSTITLDQYFSDISSAVKLVKIDVEGAEHQVLKGYEEYLKSNKPIVVMEYLSATRGNASHIEAEKFMNGIGYEAQCISAAGLLVPISSVSEHMVTKGLDSDNIVFVKK